MSLIHKMSTAFEQFWSELNHPDAAHMRKLLGKRIMNITYENRFTFPDIEETDFKIAQEKIDWLQKEDCFGYTCHHYPRRTYLSATREDMVEPYHAELYLHRLDQRCIICYGIDLGISDQEIFAVLFVHHLLCFFGTRKHLQVNPTRFNMKVCFHWSSDKNAWGLSRVYLKPAIHK